MKKILMINYVFPPIPYAGTYRSLRLCREFQKRGIETHILTINVYNDIPNDNTLLEKVPKQVLIHRTPIIDPWRWFQRWKKQHENMWGFKYINKIASILLWFFCLPDHMILWAPFALARGIKIIRKYHIDTVYVSSPPHSTQIIGLFLKKITGIKLIADLRDPIVDNVYDIRLDRPYNLQARIEKCLKGGLERWIVGCADKIVVNTETHRREMLERHGKDIFVTIRNSFDKDDFNGINGTRYDVFTIAHVGSIYGLRHPDILLKALKRFEQITCNGQLRLQIIFAGLNDSYLMESVKLYGVEKYVKIMPLVPHREAIEIMMRSHLLLLIKAMGPGSLGQIPGKFFEYIGTGNKILFLGSARSEVADIIREMNAGYIFEHDENGIIDMLSREYGAFLEGDSRRLASMDIEKFSSEHMADKMIDLFEEE